MSNIGKSYMSLGPNTSASRILGAPSFLRGNDTINNPAENAEEGENEDKNILVSLSISEADPFDFGYYKLIKKVEENKEEDKVFNPNKSSLFNVMQNAIKNVNKFSIKKMNLLKDVNEIEIDNVTGRAEKNVKSNKELVFNFAKEENDYRNFQVPLFENFKSIPDAINGVGRSMTMNSKKSKISQKVAAVDEIQQTGNSYILKQQSYEISTGNIEHAHKLNYEYAVRKMSYEVRLILKLIGKFEDSLKPGKSIKIEFPLPFQEMRRECAKLLEKYKKVLSPDKEELENFKFESIPWIVEFMKRIEREIDDKPQKSKNLEVKKFTNYSKWKKKLSELVNIWELFSSNGISMKFPVKYLILKRYLTMRSIQRQNDLEKGVKYEDNENFLKKLIFDLLGLTGQSKSIPKAIFLPNELLNILSEILISITLLYSMFSIPLIEFLGMNSSMTSSLEKYVDVIFFVELNTNFRKVFRDKANEFVYDINKIFKRYASGSLVLDLLSTMPWYFFFINNLATMKLVKMWVMCIKILRVIKLSSAISRLEQTKAANYVRLFKLVFIFFFFAHWLGCMIFVSITTSLQYDKLHPSCYVTSLNKNKDNLNFSCKYMYVIYQSSYIIPGQYTNSMTGLSILSSSSEYGMYVFLYMIGQILSAYIFGGMASIIQNLNQGQNFFTSKMDMINDHMFFYDVNPNTMKDVKLYYQYMWQRHKDMIWGKYHFDKLSRSLREKFERLNLPGNEILLAKFYNLNPGNTKLIGSILMNLSKVILFPYEILFEVGSVAKGIYILLNGDVELSNNQIQTLKTSNHIINYAEIIEELNSKKKSMGQINYYDEKNSVIFPLVSVLIKTGRNWQRCFSCNFSDLLFLPLKSFEDILFNFPIEMHIFKHRIIEWVASNKLFDNVDLFKIISKHSSRSIGKYFEKEFDKISIWLTIPIPISQRKIAGNYIDSFIKKVRNQWREIKLVGDLNISLNSFSAVSLLKNSGKKSGGEKNEKDISEDPIERIKVLSKEIEKLTQQYMNEYDA